jgi:hypothetical protein
VCYVSWRCSDCENEGLRADNSARAVTDCARGRGSGRGGQQTVQGVQEESEWEILEMAASSPAPQRVTTRDALANVSRNKYIPCPLSLCFFLFFWISCSSTLRLLYFLGVMAKCPFLRWFSPRPASLDILPVMRSHLCIPLLSCLCELCVFVSSLVPYGMSMAPCLLAVLPSVGYFFPAGHVCLSYAQVVTAIQSVVSDAFVNHRAFHHILGLCWFNVSSYLVPASYHDL